MAKWICWCNSGYWPMTLKQWGYPGLSRGGRGMGERPKGEPLEAGSTWSWQRWGRRQGFPAGADVTPCCWRRAAQRPLDQEWGWASGRGEQPHGQPGRHGDLMSTATKKWILPKTSVRQQQKTVRVQWCSAPGDHPGNALIYVYNFRWCLLFQNIQTEVQFLKLSWHENIISRSFGFQLIS